MIRVLLAEPAGVISAALSALFGREDDIAIVAEVGDYDDLVAKSVAHRPDVALIDIDDSEDVVAAVLDDLHRLVPECRTILLTETRDSRALRRAISRHGWGVVSKEADPRDLIAAIRRVVAGDYVLEPELAAAARNGHESPLTPRELEVLGFTAGGMPVEEVAATIGIAVGTVRNYLSVINMKLGARNRIDAVRIARFEGWLEG